MSMISIEVKPVEDNISLLITLTTEEASNSWNVSDWPISTVHPSPKVD
jgi:hypothetical protein